MFKSSPNKAGSLAIQIKANKQDVIDCRPQLLLRAFSPSRGLKDFVHERLAEKVNDETVFPEV